jgi:hypothetical protein
MPTPTGLLRRGDRIRHTETGTVCVVQERFGNDATYSVWLQREDGGLFPPSSGTSHDRRSLLLLEAAYWIEHGWKVLSD